MSHTRPPPTGGRPARQNTAPWPSAGGRPWIQTVQRAACRNKTELARRRTRPYAAANATLRAPLSVELPMGPRCVRRVRRNRRRGRTRTLPLEPS
eukprot:170783-Pyramimonas_sp.AAC.1